MVGSEDSCLGSQWVGCCLPAVLLALSLGCGRFGDGQATAESAAQETLERRAVVVAVEPVRREPMPRFYSSTATLRAEKRATVTARTQGVIRRLLVEEGDRVESGQALARLDDEEQRVRWERAKKVYESLLVELRRQEKVHGEALISDEALDASRQQAIDAKHAMELARLAFERTVIRSPFSGVILSRHQDPGDLVTEGSPVYDVASVDPLYADVNVPERQIQTLEAGQEVLLEADASGVETEARILRISPQVDPSSGTVKVTLVARTVPGLRPGSFVRAHILTGLRPEALVVPRSSLIADGPHWYLFRLEEGSGRVRRLDLDLGYEDDDRVEVRRVVRSGDDARSPALQVGDLVVTTGAAALTDGAEIVVVEDGRVPT